MFLMMYLKKVMTRREKYYKLEMWIQYVSQHILILKIFEILKNLFGIIIKSL